MSAGGAPGRRGRPLRHHDLCFGCGRTNLFGLLAEIESELAGAATGRCFLKQDHQGPEPGSAHPGVIAAALLEAMSLALGPDARPQHVEFDFTGRAPVGAFLELEAQAGGADGQVSATARHGANRVAAAVGSFIHGAQLHPADPR